MLSITQVRIFKALKVSDRPSTQPVTDYPSELEAILKNVAIASANPSNQL
jgi:hypothetical protein